MTNQKLLQVFETKDASGDIRVSVFDNFVEVIEDVGFNFKKTYEGILYKSPFSLSADPQTEYEITKLIIRNFKKEALGKKEKLCLNFYTHFKLETIEPFEYEHAFEHKYHKVKELLKLGPYGLEIYAFNRLKYIVKPDRILFAGPYTENLPVEIRYQLRESVFNALGKQNDIKITDCFPMIDYKALEKERFRLSCGDQMKGSELSIEAGYLYYTGWSSPKDGGAQSFPLEWFLFYDEDFFNLLTNHEYSSIHAELQEIIKKHSISDF